MLILHSFGVLSLLGGGCYYLHIAVENIVADALDYGDINANVCLPATLVNIGQLVFLGHLLPLLSEPRFLFPPEGRIMYHADGYDGTIILSSGMKGNGPQGNRRGESTQGKEMLPCHHSTAGSPAYIL